MFIAAVALAAGLAVSAAAEPFSLVVLPDTQNYSRSSANAPLFTQQTQWIADQVEGSNPDNIVFVTHVGDVVSNGDNATEIARAQASLSVLDGGLPDSVIPWSVLPGNHDYATTGDKPTGTDDYVAAFGPARFSGKTWFGGGDLSGNNTYQFFEGDGVTYMHIALEHQPTINVTNGPTRDPSPIEWAQRVIRDNPGIPTIVSTHAYVDDSPPGRSGTGEALWNELIRKNDQIIMVLNGHYHSASVPTNDGEYHQVSVNDFGSDVIEVLQDYQDYPNGGDGWLRIVTFDPDSASVRFQTYSPVLDQFQTETVADVGPFASDFTLPIDFTFDFAEPPEPPAPVFETVTIQQGVDGYFRTLDKEIRSSGGDASNGNAPSISVDGDDGSPGLQPNQGLVQFPVIIGDSGRPFTPGDPVLDAALVLNVTNPGSGLTVYRMTEDWNESTVWTDFGSGVQPGVDTDPTPVTSIGADNGSSNVGTGSLSLDVTDAFNAWLGGAPNNGFALIPFTNGTNGIDFDSSEGTVPPALVVRRLLPGITRNAFVEGIDGYAGTQDAELRQADPADNFGTNTSISVDADDPSGSGNDNQALIRFDGVFTETDDLDVLRATLTLNGFNPGDGGTLHRMLIDWSEDTATWDLFTGGVQADGVQAVAAPDAAAAGGTGPVAIDVTASVQAWRDGADNFGWVILPSGDNGWDFDTSESAPAARPRLEIFFGEAADPACNPADLAEPFGVLDLSDTDAFIAGFAASDPAADLAAPAGVFDLSDIDAFIGAFLAGCP